MDSFQSFDNIFGGHNYTHNDHSFETRPNDFDGENIYVDGRLEAYTSGNIFGGEDIFELRDGLIASSHHDANNDTHIFSQFGDLLGTVSESSDGLRFDSFDGQTIVETQNFGNFTEIMAHNDPLIMANDYILPAFLL